MARNMLTGSSATSVGIKTYTCHICKYSTTYLTNYKRHMRRHTGQLFRCEVCGVQYNCRYYLQKHILRNHGSQPTNAQGLESSSGVFVNSGSERVTDYVGACVSEESGAAAVTVESPYVGVGRKDDAGGTEQAWFSTNAGVRSQKERSAADVKSAGLVPWTGDAQSHDWFN